MKRRSGESLVQDLPDAARMITGRVDFAPRHPFHDLAE